MKLYEGFSTGLAVILQEKLRSALTMLGIVIGIAFGLYPAVRASQISPIEALRTE